MVAPDQRRDWLAIGQVDQQLGGRRLVDPEEVAELLDRPAVGGLDPLEGGGRRLARCRRGADARLGPLAVGGVAALRALHDRVLADRAGDHELVRDVAADRTALGFDDHVGDAAAVEDLAIRLVHRVVAGVQLLQVGIEAVGVLHHELAGPEDAEPRPRFVAELRLDLVERHRQLLVRADQRADQLGDDLLVRRPQGHRLVAADGQLHQQFAEGLVPPRLLPKIDRLQRRHQELERPGGVHLLADHLDDLVEHPEPERQVGVRPRADLADHARAE